MKVGREEISQMRSHRGGFMYSLKKLLLTGFLFCGMFGLFGSMTPTPVSTTTSVDKVWWRGGYRHYGYTPYYYHNYYYSPYYYGTPYYYYWSPGFHTHYWWR